MCIRDRSGAVGNMIDSRYFLIFIMAICWVLVFIIAYKGKKQEETVRKSKETADIIYEAQLETDDYEKKVCQLIKEIKSKINDYSELSGCLLYTSRSLLELSHPFSSRMNKQ